MEGEPLEAGSVIAGRYAVESLIAKGGFGQVFLARHVHLQNKVAIKVIHPEAANTSSMRDRFLREARVVAELRHPHIVQIHDLGELDDGSLYLAMEYLEGRELSERMKEGSLSAADSTSVIKQVGSALLHAHNRGIVHRDMKPSNIMLEERSDGSIFAKVIDFGILKHYGDEDHIDDGVTQGLTGTTTLLGTPHYMSPEQIKQKPIDPRTDQYALGIIAYELLGGHKPFNGTTTIDIIVAHIEHPVPDLATLTDGSSAPPDVTRVLERALAKRPDDRYPDIAEFATQLGRAIRPDEAPAPTPPGKAFAPEDATIMADNPLTKPARPSRVPPPNHGHPQEGRRWGWAAAVAVLALGAGAWMFSPSGDSPRTPAVESREASPGKETPRSIAAVIAPAVPIRIQRPIEDAIRVGPRRLERPSIQHQAVVAPKPKSAKASPIARKNRRTDTPSESKSALKGPPGRLSVIARPTGTIFVDGKSHGDVGVRGLRLSPGKHTVRVKGPDGSSRRVQVQIAPGTEYRLLVDLSTNTHKLKEVKR